MCEAPRALNRAALARQHLLARTASSAYEMIEQLVDYRLRRHWGGAVEQTRQLRATELSALLRSPRRARIAHAYHHPSRQRSWFDAPQQGVPVRLGQIEQSATACPNRAQYPVQLRSLTASRGQPFLCM